MFIDLVVLTWRDVTDLDAQLTTLPAPVHEEAVNLATFAADHTLEEADQRFLQASPAVQEATVLWLLVTALGAYDDPRVACWSAEYAGHCLEALNGEQTALLTVHSRFVLAWALQLNGSRTPTEALLSEIERQYGSVTADRTFPALTACTLGVLALEADDVEGNRVGIPGAREAFKRAQEYAAVSSTHPQLAEVLGYAEQLLIQWGWLDTLLASADPEKDLDQYPSWVDDNLAQLMRGRMRRLAACGADVESTYHAGELTDLVLAREGEPTGALSELTAWLLRARRMADAEWVLHRRLDDNPEDDEVLQQLAHVYVDEGKYAEALPLLASLVTASPDDLHLHSMAAMALWQIGNLPAAYQEFCEVLRLNPDDAITQDMVRKLRPAACIVFLDGALRYHPDIELLSPEEMKAGVMAAVLAAQPDRIEEGLKNVAENDPDALPLLFEVLVTRGLVSAPEPEGARGHLQRAEDHFAKGEWPEATSAYEAAIQENHDLEEAYMGLGDVHYREGRFYLARAFFEESIAVQPSPLACRFLGDTLTRMRKLEQAADYYRQALQLLPGYTGARQALDEVEAELLRDGKHYRTPDQTSGESTTPQEPFEHLLDWYAARFEPRAPNHLPELETNLAQQMPGLGRALTVRDLQERMALMRRNSNPREWEPAILALSALGFFHRHHAAQPDTAVELCRFRLALAEELGRQRPVVDQLALLPARHQADAWCELAALSAEDGRLTDALEQCRKAERAYEEDLRQRQSQGLPPHTEFDRLFVRHDPRALLYSQMSTLLEKLGDAVGSGEYGRRAAELDRQNPSIETQIQVSLTTGQVALEHGEPDHGLAALWRALDLALEDRASRISSHHVATTYHLLGQAHASLGLARMARHWYERALDLNRRSGHRTRQRRDYVALAELYATRPDLGDAIEAQFEAAWLVDPIP